MKEKMRKHDMILFVVCLSIAFLIFFFQYVVFAKQGAKVTVTVDGIEIGCYVLSENQQIPISTEWGYNLLVIEEGNAFMLEADCPDYLCVKQKQISLTGESIVCLPHRLIITVIDGEEAELDSVTF